MATGYGLEAARLDFLGFLALAGLSRALLASFARAETAVLCDRAVSISFAWNADDIRSISRAPIPRAWATDLQGFMAAAISAAMVLASLLRKPK
jgi:hypothetical protein